MEIIKLLGTPTREQIQQMNPNYREFRFPSIRAHPWLAASDIVFMTYSDMTLDVKVPSVSTPDADGGN